MERVVKSISFNMEDVSEKNLLIHANQSRNFSQYIKRLIAIDMSREGARIFGPLLEKEGKEEKETAQQDRAAMNTFF